MLEGEGEDEIVDFGCFGTILILAQDCANDQGGSQDQLRIRFRLAQDEKWMTTKGWLISWISLVSIGGWARLG